MLTNNLIKDKDSLWCDTNLFASRLYSGGPRIFVRGVNNGQLKKPIIIIIFLLCGDERKMNFGY